MSWSAFVVPLHDCPPDVLEWVREFAPNAIPERLPEPRPLPTVEQILAALRDAGCRWDPWYELAAPAAPSSGLYLGEMSIKVVDGEFLVDVDNLQAA